MAFIEKRIYSGKIIEVIKYDKPVRYDYARSERKEVTPEQMEKVNELNSISKLERLFRCNFSMGDYHIVQTYSKEKWGTKGPTPEQAKKEYNKFMRKMRNHYKKLGKEFRYIAVTEYKANRIHHHIIIEKIDTDILQEFWKENGHINITQLYPDYDYRQLAKYLIKEKTKTNQHLIKNRAFFGKRWNPSRNLKKPKEDKPKHIKRGDVLQPPKEVRGISKGFKKYQHCKLIDQHIGVHTITGMPYSYWKIIDYSRE